MKYLRNKRHVFLRGELIKPYNFGTNTCTYLVMDWIPCKPNIRQDSCHCSSYGEMAILKCLDLPDTHLGEYCMSESLEWTKVTKSSLSDYLQKEYGKWVKKIKA